MPKYDRKDAAYRAAKDQGLRSRAALKLRELDQRFRLFAPGARVVELGCWPGGWLQIASMAVGDNGRVVGVDLAAVEPLGLVNVSTVVGDVRDPAVVKRTLAELGGRADVLLSDLAPKLSGIRTADDARHEALVEIAVQTAAAALSPHGAALIKLFSTCESQMTALMRKTFEEVSKVRPSTTRKGSSEIYALGRRPRNAVRPRGGDVSGEPRA